MTFLCSAYAVSFALAQGTTIVTPTTGVGDLGTAITANGKTVQITGGTRPGDGANLFHSFDQFRVGPGDTAQFLNTTPSFHTDNILSRVIGGNPSTLFGTIDTMSYPGANFFLMNPAGIVFGPNATLNVSGSVAFTTANYLRLAETNGSNAGIFHAGSTATSLLTSASVAAFGFLGTNPSAISVLQGLPERPFKVQPDQSISLVGGDQGFTYIDSVTGNSVSTPGGVTVTGREVLAPGGQIHIASVASPGEVLARTLDQGSNINGQTLGALGTVQISQNSSLNTMGEGNGKISIRGGRLIVNASTIISNAGEISLDATSIDVTDHAGIATSTTTTDSAGHIILKASGDIVLDSNAVVGSFSIDSSGHTGDITFSSTQGNVRFAGSSFVTSQVTGGSGNAGHIKIDAPHGDIILDNAHVFNVIILEGTGKLGGIQIRANNLLMGNEAGISGANFNTQRAENIAIMLNGRLNLTGNSTIATTTPGSADAADLIVTSPNIHISENSRLSTSTTSSGNGGQLSLFTDHLQLTNGGRLSSGSLRVAGSEEIPSGRGGSISIEAFKSPGARVLIDGPESGIFTNAQGKGPAGNIDVKTTAVALRNGGTLSAETTGTSSTATGGSITVNATDQVAMTNGASISASSTGTADAGKIKIDAGKQLSVQDSKITTEAKTARGGNIEVIAKDRIQLANGQISTSVLEGAGDSGKIFIDPNEVIVQNNSTILTQAVRGRGGDITILTPRFLQDSTSLVDASSQFGPSGKVTIQSSTSNLSGTVAQLSSKTDQTQPLLQNRCVALAGGEQSTLILAGRDTLPSEPGGWLSSPVSMEHWTGGDTEEHASGLIVRRNGPNGLPAMATHNGETKTLSLRRLTPPGFLVRTFSTGSTGCPS